MPTRLWFVNTKDRGSIPRDRMARAVSFGIGLLHRLDGNYVENYHGSSLLLL